jgi:hypothetical protein
MALEINFIFFIEKPTHMGKTVETYHPSTQHFQKLCFLNFIMKVNGFDRRKNKVYKFPVFCVAR